MHAIGQRDPTAPVQPSFMVPTRPKPNSINAVTSTVYHRAPTVRLVHTTAVAPFPSDPEMHAWGAAMDASFPIPSLLARTQCIIADYARIAYRKSLPGHGSCGTTTLRPRKDVDMEEYNRVVGDLSGSGIKNPTPRALRRCGRVLRCEDDHGRLSCGHGLTLGEP